jgi:hypothetical protein
MSLCEDYLLAPIENDHFDEITDLRNLAVFSAGITEVFQQRLVYKT